MSKKTSYVTHYQTVNQKPSYNGQNEKGQKTNNGLQNTAQKTKDRATRTALSICCELIVLQKASSSCSTSGSCHVSFKRHEIEIVLDIYKKSMQITNKT